MSILYLLVFHAVFSLFQNDSFYSNTLGSISSNYLRTGDWNDGKILKKDTVFVERTSNNYLNWDASIYHCIAKRMYVLEDSCYGKVRAAFFPAFPLIWKASGLSPPSMSIFNFLLFAFALALAFSFFSNLPFREVVLAYLVLISLPTSLIFQMPYTESLFVLSMIVGSVGLWKDKYGLYLFGFALMAMVRPATVFVLFAIALTDLGRSIQKKSSIKDFFKSASLKGLPFLVGYILAFSIQIYSSGSVMAFWDAHSFWSATAPENWQIVDWSVEGFAMNAFAIFFLAIPACIGAFRTFFNDLSKPRNYLLSVSLFYLVGIFVFTAITSGGNLHSFFRFELASPCFFIAAIFFLDRSKKDLWSQLFKFILLPLAGLLTFLAFVDYGGDRLRFEYLGAYLLIASFTYLLVYQRLVPFSRYLILSVLLLGNILFGTYLLNMFLSNVWIFT